MDSSKTEPILVILAGGKSSRMGSPKGLLDFKGKPWILAQLDAYRGVNNAKAYIGLGFDCEMYFDQIEWFSEAAEIGYNYNGIWVRVFVNEHPEMGPFSTLLTIVSKIAIQSILVLPIDVPLLSKYELTKILANDSQIVIPTYKAKKGHPVKLSTEFCKNIVKVDLHRDDARLDTQIEKTIPASISYVPVIDSKVILNLNRPKEWNEYLESVNLGVTK